MSTSREENDVVRRIKVSLNSAGFDIKKVRIDLQPSVIVVVKPAQYMDAEVWDRLTAFLKRLGFYWYREDSAWKKGMLQ